MEELPGELTMDILSRLAVKTIIHCKSVCKKWRNLVSDSFFVNLHLSRSPTGLIMHRNHWNVYEDPGKLEWLEIEDKVDDHHLHHDPLMTFDLNLTPILQNSRIDQMGSVNGLIFLWQHSPKLKFDDTYIVNPVTREIMSLRSPRYHRQGSVTIEYGFGVSSLTGKYKVVRAFRKAIPLNGNKSYKLSVLEAEVYTIGTGQWRSLGQAPYGLDGSFNGRFLNDHFHWIVCDEEEDAPEKICTFDLNKETFQLFPSPPSEAIEESDDDHYQSLGILKGCLCISDGDNSQLTIWVMKEYGIKKSWHKEVVITEAISHGPKWPFAEPISLIESLKDGSILLHSGWSLWEFSPGSDTIEYMELEGIDCSCTENGLAYRPSFLKLQKFESERVHMF